MAIQPYLFFDGRCEEALEFYKKALGAEVTMMMRFGESPVPMPSDKVVPGQDKMIMHSNVQIGDTQIMASDGFCSGKPSFSGFALSILAKTEAEADKFFGALADGGSVQMPLAKTFWSQRFGMVTDRFGVMWMVSMAPG